MAILYMKYLKYIDKEFKIQNQLQPLQAPQHINKDDKIRKVLGLGE